MPFLDYHQFNAGHAAKLVDSVLEKIPKELREDYETAVKEGWYGNGESPSGNSDKAVLWYAISGSAPQQRVNRLSVLVEVLGTAYDDSIGRKDTITTLMLGNILKARLRAVGAGELDGNDILRPIQQNEAADQEADDGAIQGRASARTPGLTPSPHDTAIVSLLKTVNKDVKFNQSHKLAPTSSVSAWRENLRAELMVVPGAMETLLGKEELDVTSDRLLRRFVWASLSDELTKRYKSEHRADNQLEKAKDLYAWAIKRCTVHSADRRQQLTATLALTKCSRTEDAAKFLQRWLEQVHDLHDLIDQAWTPLMKLQNLKYVLPADQHPSMVSHFVAFDKTHSTETAITHEHVNDLFDSLLRTAHDSTSTPRDIIDPLVDGAALQAVARSTDCWSCGRRGHRWRQCPNNEKKQKFQEMHDARGGSIKAHLALLAEEEDVMSTQQHQ